MKALVRLLAGISVVAAVAIGVPGTAQAAGPALQDRVNAASGFAASRGTALGFAVLDRLTGEYADNGGAAHTRIESASVVKVFIADSILLRRDQGRVGLTQGDYNDMAAMLRSSDDAVASRLWSRFGGNGIIDDVKARYRLAEIAPTSNARYWGNVQITAHDMVNYYERMLSGTGGLAPASRDFLLEQLRLSTPHGTDGFWQWFGLRDGLPGEGTIRQKQGWMCCVNGDIYRHSTGLVGPDSRFIVAALARQPSGYGAGHIEQSLTGAVRTAFPEGVIPGGLTGIDQVWLRTGGIGGPLGRPVGAETYLPHQHGAFRPYERGAVYASASTGIHWILGAIQQSWASQGWESGRLGYPSTDELALPGRPGAFQWFQGGAVYWSPPTGAHWVHGSIAMAWAAHGYETGHLGLPVTDQVDLANGGFNAFEGGAIYSSPAAGAHPIRGAIMESWARQGWQGGPLEYPTMAEAPLPRRFGAFQWFQGGAVYWSPPTGAHWIHGSIAMAWAAQGYETGRLGLPVTDQINLGNGAFNAFEGGAIYTSPATGAHWIVGAIMGSWAQQGWQAGPLGYPVTDELGLVGRQGAYQVFQGGTAYWSPGSGAHWLPTAHHAAWLAHGGHGGGLGLPTSDPFAVAEGVRVGFEGGSVTVAPDGRATVVGTR